MKSKLMLNFLAVLFLKAFGEQLYHFDFLAPKGEKGEAGAACSCAKIQRKTELIADNITRALVRGYMKLEDGWITPFNGYQYKLNQLHTSWEKSREACQSWKGDLIVNGMQDFSAKITITRALGISRSELVWIGMHYTTSDKMWRWVNQQPVSTDDVTLWNPNQPDNSISEQCGVLINRFVHDAPCSWNHTAICEKLV